MDFKPKNREWVKNAAIIFLAVLLVLTFFSNTIMNRTLPEVATQYVTSGTVTARVRGTGTVVANGSHQVKADATREIRAVMVRVGQEVQAGDVLFVLGAGAADELEAAQEQLRQLQISYQRAAINAPTFNYTASERKIKAAKEKLDEAKAKLESAQKNLSEDEKKEIAETEKALGEAQAQLESMEKKVQEEYQAALDRVNAAQAELDRLLSQAPSGGTTTPDPTPSEPGTTPPAESEPDPEPDTSGDTQSEDTAAASAEPAVVAELAAPVALSMDAMPIAAESAEIQAARQELADAKAALEQMNMGPDPRVTMAQTLVDTLQTKLDALTNTPEINAAKAEVKAAEEAYYELKDALDRQKESDDKSLALSGLDLMDISAQIERQKKKIEELSGGDGNQVLANVSGTIESIECTAGDTVLDGSVLCSIEIPDMGYTLSFSVTNEQARRLAPGDTATVSNYYWGTKIDATLSTIRVDPKNPQANKLLTFDLEGDVNAGSEITLSVGQRSAGYDTIVPNSAIRSDTNGQFVLIIESKNSPLGNRYIARRVDVQVLASDDVNSAVTGDLSSWSYVITTSNAPVNSGDMVRMADT